MPLITRPRTAATELVRILLPKLTTPFPNRLIGYDHPTFTQQFFDITEAQTEAKVQPDGVANDLNRKPMVLVAWGCCSNAHTATVSYSRSIKQVVNAL